MVVRATQEGKIAEIKAPVGTNVTTDVLVIVLNFSTSPHCRPPC